MIIEWYFTALVLLGGNRWGYSGPVVFGPFESEERCEEVATWMKKESKNIVTACRIEK